MKKILLSILLLAGLAGALGVEPYQTRSGYLYIPCKRGDGIIASETLKQSRIWDGMCSGYIDPDDWDKPPIISAYNQGEVLWIEVKKTTKSKKFAVDACAQQNKPIDGQAYPTNYRSSAYWVNFDTLAPFVAAQCNDFLNRVWKEKEQITIIKLDSIPTKCIKDAQTINIDRPLKVDVGSITSGTYTVGSGGSYATYGGAGGAGAALGNLTGNLILTTITALTETARMRPEISLGGYTLTINSDSPHYGNPTAGNKISVNITVDYPLDLQMEGPGTCEIYDIYFYWTGAANSGNRMINLDVITQRWTLNLHDCLLDGNGIKCGLGLAQIDSSATMLVWNNVGWECNAAFNLGVTGTGTVFENNVAFNNNIGFHGSVGYASTARNNAGFKNATNDFTPGWLKGGVTGYNNYSGDTTSKDANYLSGSGNASGQILMNAFYDTADASSSFLDILIGSVLSGSGVVNTLSRDTCVRGRTVPGPLGTSVGATEAIIYNTSIWDNDSGDYKWSTAANWTSNTLPVITDTVRYDNTSDDSCHIDANFKVARFDAQAAYGGGINFGAAVCTVSTETDLAGTGTAWLGTSTLNLYADVDIGASQVINKGTASMVFGGTGACGLTSSGETLPTLIVNKTAGSFANSDVMVCDALDINDGEVTIANNVTVSGDVTNDANDAFTQSDTVTITGAAAQFHIASSVTPTMTSASILATGAAPVIDIDATATVGRLQLGASSRASVTGGGTVTYTNPPTLGDVVVNQTGSTTFGAGLAIDSLVQTAGALAFSGLDSMRLATSIGDDFTCTGDTLIQKHVSGSGGNVIKDASTLWKILDGGSITGFAGDTLPRVEALGDIDF